MESHRPDIDEIVRHLRTSVASKDSLPRASKKLVKIPPIDAPLQVAYGFPGIVCPRTVFSV
jgi:hypothetical protein